MSSTFDRSSGNDDRAGEPPARGVRTRMEYAPQRRPESPAREMQGTASGDASTLLGRTVAVTDIPAGAPPEQGVVLHRTLPSGAPQHVAPAPPPDAIAHTIRSHAQFGGAASPKPAPPEPRIHRLAATEPPSAADVPRRAERPTEFVDMHALRLRERPSAVQAEQPVPRRDDEVSYARPLTSEASPASRVAVQLRSDSEMRERKYSAIDPELERSIRSPVARGPLLLGACALALGLMVLSFAYKRPASAPPVGNVAAPVAAPTVRAPSLPDPLAAAAPRTGVPDSAPDNSAAPPKPLATAASAPANVAGERGGATQQSAAALYLKGQYKEALAEYRLLASAYPQVKAYAEFARILKRKLFDSCVRTQPNRREQCKQL
jgi:hypothetical protein